MIDLRRSGHSQQRVITEYLVLFVITLRLNFKVQHPLTSAPNKFKANGWGSYNLMGLEVFFCHMRCKLYILLLSFTSLNATSTWVRLSFFLASRVIQVPINQLPIAKHYLPESGSEKEIRQKKAKEAKSRHNLNGDASLPGMLHHRLHLLFSFPELPLS